MLLHLLVLIFLAQLTLVWWRITAKINRVCVLKSRQLDGAAQQG